MFLFDVLRFRPHRHEIRIRIFFFIQPHGYVRKTDILYVGTDFKRCEVSRYRIAAQIIRLLIHGRGRIRGNMFKRNVFYSAYPDFLFGNIRVCRRLQIHFKRGYARYVLHRKICNAAVLFFAVFIRIYARLNPKRFVHVPPVAAVYALYGKVFYRAEIDGRIIPVVSVQRNQIVFGMPRKVFDYAVFYAAVYMQAVGETVFETYVFYRKPVRSA